MAQRFSQHGGLVGIETSRLTKEEAGLDGTEV
jgi:hypothetical protein